MAKLYFRYGAMNCGKSTALIQVAYNYRERNMNTVIIKPETDTKGSDKVISRLDVERTADILATRQDNFYVMIENWQREKGPVHCVLVDEAQFLTHSQVDQLFEVAVILDIPVICYGLRTDFLLNGFEGSARLLLMAHSIEELKDHLQMRPEKRSPTAARSEDALSLRAPRSPSKAKPVLSMNRSARAAISSIKRNTRTVNGCRVGLAHQIPPIMS